MSETGAPRVRQVLVAVDDSDASRRTVDFVNEFFAGLDVVVIGLNVASVPDQEPATTYEAPIFAWPFPAPSHPVDEPVLATTDLDAAVERGRAAIQETGLRDDEEIVRVGPVVQTILTVAAQRDVDLIVLGSNHKGVFERLWSGSTSSGVTRSSDRPVLVVP